MLVFDGAKGVMLQKAGLRGGECPELWNVTHRDEVKRIYTLYKESGADVIQTNTFQGNRMCLEKYSLGNRTYELNFEGAAIAKEVMGGDGFVAASVGPVGKLFEPMGELTFELAYETFKEQIKALSDAGVDIVNFETFTDISEMRAALLAAKESTDLPVICSLSFEQNGKTLMGTDPYTAAVVLKSLGADMVGVNCSFGPDMMLDVLKGMHEAGGVYLSVKPNAGIPEIVDGRAVFCETPERFAGFTAEFVKYGARLIGGCCGTTPEFVKAIRAEVDRLDVPQMQNKRRKVITSDIRVVSLEGTKGISVGRIDAASDAEVCNEIKAGNMDYLAEKSQDILSDGHDALYINIDGCCGSPGLLAKVVNAAQPFARIPFIIETSDHEALDEALRLYRGKAGVIVDDKNANCMNELLSVANKYGSTIVERNFILPAEGRI